VAKTRGPIRPKDTAALNLERQRLFLAMQELHQDAVPGNPLTALLNETVTALAASESMSSAETFRYLGLEETRRRERLRERTRRRILEKWARDAQLLNADGQPAAWIVDYAQRVWASANKQPELAGRPRSIFDPTSEPDDWYPLGRGVPPNQSIGILEVPMADPYQQVGEPFAEFKKRARKALTRYFSTLARRHPRSTSQKEMNPVSQKQVGLDHHKWFLLFQCCRWKQTEIRSKYPHVHSPQAISNGIRRIANTLGLSVRDRHK
jgi:hypothetical protein